MTALARFEPLRRLGFAGISGAYATVGSPLDNPARAFCITNTTQGDLIFAFDSGDADGRIIVVAGSYKLWDVQSNINPQFDDKFVLPVGAQFYVKADTAAVSGDVFIEILY